MPQRLVRSPLLWHLPTRQWTCPHHRLYSSPSSPRPLLTKIRTDLKTAMKAKDTARLNVLRSLISEVNNAEKSASPIKSDMQLLSLLRKRQAAAKAASDEFKGAGRQDLVDREEGQVKILDEYAGSVETMDIEDVKVAVKHTVDELKAKEPGLKPGFVMKALFAPGGALDGKNVEKSTVPALVKELLG